jgi:predicted negative regulator of RcsB-dependent stress response
MAVYDLEEQEQLDDLKAWWKRWGNLVSGIVIAVCVAIVGVQGWRWWKHSQAEQASVLYGAVVAASRSNDAAKAKDAQAQLADRFAGTGYAPRGAMLLAALLWKSGDKAGAQAQLQFALDRSGEDDLKQIARFRLAEVLFDQKKNDEALRLLDAKHDEPFAGIYADLTGDILAASGRKDEARTAYQTALAKLDGKSPYRSYVQVKLDSLGGPLAAAAGGAAAPAPAGTTGPAPAAAPAAPATAAPAAPKR